MHDVPSFKLTKLLSSVGEQMRIALGQSLVPHPGELGTAREEVIRAFLRKHLPKRFGVSTGFVFDWQGNVSNQIDVVIYDQYVCPEFEVAGDKKFFPCESVICAGQIKTALTSTREVHKALDNLRSVKVLDRSAGGENRSVRSGDYIDQLTNHLDQIFTFVFIVDRGLTVLKMRDAILAYIRDHPRHLWPNVFFNFDKYLFTYCCADGICPNPLHAKGISVSDNCSREELLIRFYMLVARATAATRVSTLPYWEYAEAFNAWNMEVHLWDSGIMPAIIE
jgi:hypothetical protein